MVGAGIPYVLLELPRPKCRLPHVQPELLGAFCPSPDHGIAATLLLKCLTVQLLVAVECKINSSVVRNFKKYHTEIFQVTDNY